MSKSKTPIIIANWRGNVSDIVEAKNILKNIDKEYKNFLKAKNKALKRKPIKKDLSFYLSLPSPFIYPIQDFIKANKNLKNIIVGAQNFDEIEKTNKNNQITFSQIKSVGAKFVILNDEYINSEAAKPKLEAENTKPQNEKPKKEEKNTANSILLQRLNSISKKVPEINDEKKAEESRETKEQMTLLKKLYNKELQILEEKVKTSLTNNMTTVLVLQNTEEDLDLLIDFVKKIIKNIHYNLFSNLIICYETPRGMINIDKIDIEDCQEKAIAIRRTIANMFGIDNAKKVRIVYGGRIDDTNIIEILENGGVDGVLLDEESVYPKFFAKILAEVS